MDRSFHASFLRWPLMDMPGTDRRSETGRRIAPPAAPATFPALHGTDHTRVAYAQARLGGARNVLYELGLPRGRE